MKYAEFRDMVKTWPIIFTRDLTLSAGFSDAQVIRNQLERWRAKGLMLRLRRGVYIINTRDRTVSPSEEYIANQLYGPSYVSMEYALGSYGLIPERVHDITSITTRKTLRIKNDAGTFIYQHIQPAAFGGFRAARDAAGLNFFIAEPEKAVVDLCYLNLRKMKGDYAAFLMESFRLQNIGTLSRAKVAHYAATFGGKKLARVSRALCELIRKEKR